jgi:hypothetical protein
VLQKVSQKELKIQYETACGILQRTRDCCPYAWSGFAIHFADLLYRRAMARKGICVSATRGVSDAHDVSFVATIYSLWMLPTNQKAEMWHFWLTAAAIGAFWASFSRMIAAGTPHASATNALVIWGQLAAVAVFLIAQLVFVANVVLALT